MARLQIFLLASYACLVLAQRPSFAGLRPIGYPELEKPATLASDLGNRFGEGTTQRLPVQANGDKDLVDRLSKLPVDKQPFWFINWQAIESHREQPQTFPLRPNPFAESPIVFEREPSTKAPTGNSAVTGNSAQTGNSLQNRNSAPTGNSAAVGNSAPSGNSAGNGNFAPLGSIPTNGLVGPTVINAANGNMAANGNVIPKENAEFFENFSPDAELGNRNGDTSSEIGSNLDVGSLLYILNNIPVQYPNFERNFSSQPAYSNSNPGTVNLTKYKN